ncbi:MAG TPA: hypothetical protein VJ124_10045 [Pyrinomonadaceae bacterium]|nr:hypothetical protein [Pyrinomonadaceae bacterium]
MQELRERGIYHLPDGNEFVIHAVSRAQYALYTPGNWEFSGATAYETDPTGQIRSKDLLTNWYIRDLTDTGRTARSRSRSGAAQSPFIG